MIQIVGVAEGLIGLGLGLFISVGTLFIMDITNR